MAEIKIVSVDKEATKQNVRDGLSKLVFNLSEAPNEQWKSDFDQARKKIRN
jgi:hypothetical protein